MKPHPGQLQTPDRLPLAFGQVAQAAHRGGSTANGSEFEAFRSADVSKQSFGKKINVLEGKV